MRFSEFQKGKIYVRTIIEKGGGGRKKKGEGQTYNMLIVEKDQEHEELLASIVPEVGKPMAPQRYKKEIYQRWKPRQSK